MSFPQTSVSVAPAIALPGMLADNQLAPDVISALTSAGFFVDDRV